MLHASALAVGWKAALLALFATPGTALTQTDDPSTDLPRLSVESDDDREPFHLDDTEITHRLAKSGGLQEYRTPPHAHLLFPPRPAR